MQRNLAALAEKEYDLIVVGGGIFGVCAAWDAVQRGLSVALLEQDDFSHATSANHFRMIHGGIRYLQHADIPRIRQSSYERSAMLRVAPHLAHPLPIVIPTYGHGMQGKELLQAGMLAYDFLTFDRNRVIQDPQHRIPPARIISRQECLALFPGIKKEGLTGAGIFYDGQTHNPARLGLAFLKSAVEAGADAANYLKMTGFLRQGNRVTGVQACDQFTDDVLDIRGRVVLNTTGPWAAWLLREKLNAPLIPEPTFSRDTCFIVKGQLTGKHALTVLGRTKDPDALISRGHRHLFLVPWQGHTLVGVWHVVHKGRPEDFTVPEVDLVSFLDEINEAYPPLQLNLGDITRWMAGLVLFGENAEGQKDLSYGKRSQVIDHAREDQVEGLVTLIGVRFTTARGMAEKAVDVVFHKLGRKPPRSRTAFTPVHGGQFGMFEDLLQVALKSRPLAVPVDAMPSLVHNHGSAYPEVLAYLQQDPALASTLGTSPVLKAEVLHAVRREMAHKLSDVVFRRTDLGSASYPGDIALRASADLMAAELGWNAARLQRELDQVKSFYVNY